MAIQCYAFILHPKTSAYGIGGYGGQNYYGDSGNYQQREYQPSYQHQGKGGYRGGYQGKNYQEDYQEQQEGFPDEGFDELGGEDLEDDEEMNEIFAAMDSMGVTDVVLHSILILPFEHKLRPLSWCWITYSLHRLIIFYFNVILKGDEDDEYDEGEPSDVYDELSQLRSLENVIQKRHQSSPIVFLLLSLLFCLSPESWYFFTFFFEGDLRFCIHPIFYSDFQFPLNFFFILV